MLILVDCLPSADPSGLSALYRFWKLVHPLLMLGSGSALVIELLPTDPCTLLILLVALHSSEPCSYFALF